jgi:hypothetical protein
VAPQTSGLSRLFGGGELEQGRRQGLASGKSCCLCSGAILAQPLPLFTAKHPGLLLAQQPLPGLPLSVHQHLGLPHHCRLMQPGLPQDRLIRESLLQARLQQEPDQPREGSRGPIILWCCTPAHQRAVFSAQCSVQCVVCSVQGALRQCAMAVLGNIFRLFRPGGRVYSGRDLVKSESVQM